jgi:streptomycin 6-kinase
MADQPPGLRESPPEAAGCDDGSTWRAAVGATVVRLARDWGLAIDAPFGAGNSSSWVAPARGPDDADLVLKLARAHWEAAHEADGLRVWAGDGAVRLYAAEDRDDTNALLLERCRPGTPLSARPEPEQDEVLAGLLPRLWVNPSAGHGFRSLESMCRRWAAECEEQLDAHSDDVDAGLVREGLALFRSLPAGADRRVLLTTDAHAGNVLSSGRGWLLIDPKPFVGDPTFDVLQHLLNCEERLRADPDGLAGRMADLLGLDAERLRRWLFARCAQEAPSDPPLADIARRLRID